MRQSVSQSIGGVHRQSAMASGIIYVHLASLAQINKVDDCTKSPAIAETQTHGSFPKLDHIYESWVLSPGFLDANGHPSTRVYPSAYIN